MSGSGSILKMSAVPFSDKELLTSFKLAADAALVMVEVLDVRGVVFSILVHSPKPALVQKFVGGTCKELTELKAELERASSRPQIGLTPEDLDNAVYICKSLANNLEFVLQFSLGTQSDDNRALIQPLLTLLQQFNENAVARTPSESSKKAFSLTSNMESDENGPGENDFAKFQHSFIVHMLSLVDRLHESLEKLEGPSGHAVYGDAPVAAPLTPDSTKTSPSPPAAAAASAQQAATAAAPPQRTQKVFFATDRKYAYKGSGEASAAYGGAQEGGNKLNYGTALLSVPIEPADGSSAPKLKPLGPGKKAADAPKQDEFSITLSSGPADIRNLSIEEAAFQEKLGKEVEGKQTLLVIHGYNTNFYGAVSTVGQLASNLSTMLGGDPVAAIAFDWASLGNALFYGGLPGDDDRDRAMEAAPKLRKFLASLMKQNGLQLHIIAHSMGNFCLYHAIKGADSALRSQLQKVRSVTFAAPDVTRADLNEMVKALQPAGTTPAELEEIAKGLKPPKGPLLTLYCSSNDMALLLSSILRGWGNFTRAGWFEDDHEKTHPFVIPGTTLDTVDASGLGDMLGHGYFATAMPIVRDIAKLLGAAAARAAKRESLRKADYSHISKDIASCTQVYMPKKLSREDATRSEV